MRWITAITIVVVLMLVFYIAALNNSPPSYISFTFHRSQVFYSQYADGCDKLIAALNPRGTNEIRLEGSDHRLPRVLNRMRATQIVVSTNGVSLIEDIAAGYSVIWAPDYYRPGIWNLTVRSESEPRVVLERKRN